MRGLVVYKHTCVVNSKSYIGCTSNFRKRTNKHLSDARLEKGNSIFHKAIRKYGFDLFDTEILYNAFDEDEMFRAEIELIERYDTFGNGYNMTIGGERPPPYIMPDEQKELNSKRMKCNNPSSLPHVRKMSSIRMKHRLLHHNPMSCAATRKKVSESQLGKKNHMYGIPPWETSGCKRSRNYYLWEVANHIYILWLQYDKCGSYKISILIGFDKQQKTIENMIKWFKNNGNPLDNNNYKKHFGKNNDRLKNNNTVR